MHSLRDLHFYKSTWNAHAGMKKSFPNPSFHKRKILLYSPSQMIIPNPPSEQMHADLGKNIRWKSSAMKKFLMAVYSNLISTEAS